ncbi:unnamed protein product, partial [Polarella glacialis]
METATQVPVAGMGIDILPFTEKTNSVITPAVLYGSGSWVLTHDTASLLKKTQWRMLRAMFQKGRRPQTNIGSDDQSSTSEQGSQTLEPDQAEEILEPWVDWIRRVTHEIEGYASAAAVEDWVLAHRRRLFTWAGHVSRRGDNRWTTRLLDWTPSGRTRQEGRPCLRWEDPESPYTFSDSPAYTRDKKASDQAKRAAELEGKDETRGFLRSVEELASKQKWEEAFQVLERRTAVPS